MAQVCSPSLFSGHMSTWKGFFAIIGLTNLYCKGSIKNNIFTITKKGKFATLRTSDPYLITLGYSEDFI